MQSTAPPALCEGFLAAHLRKSSPPLLLTAPPPLSPRRTKHGIFCHSRYLERRLRNVCINTKSLKKSEDVPTSTTHDNSFRYIHANKAVFKSIQFVERLYNDIAGLDTGGTGQISGDFVSRMLKFAMILGFLTLQVSQQAIAGTELSSGMQVVSFLGDLGDDISTGFASAFLLIFFSELGDKTFFIAALLAARNSSGVVFVGTFGALSAMTLISVFLGRTFHYVDGILPFKFGTDLPVDDIAAVCLLVYFGITTLIDAASDDSSKTDEEKKGAELAISELSGNDTGTVAANTIISTFLLVFVAEWGDKSFFSTISLSAAASPFGVIAGALVGHAFATTVAVVGGSLIESFFSEKAIAYIGGALFLIFAAVTVVEIVN